MILIQRFVFIFSFFLMSCSLWATDQEEIYRGLKADHYKARKAAFKLALELPYDAMESLLGKLVTSNDPELKDAAKRLSVAFAKLKKERTQPLPKDIHVSFQQAHQVFGSMSFQLSLPEEKYAFDTKEIKILKIAYGNVVYDEEQLKKIREGHSTSGANKVKRWSMAEGLDDIFPVKQGEYKVKITVQTPESKWLIEHDYKRNIYKEPKALAAFVKSELIVFLESSFYKNEYPEEHYKKLAAFMKEFPDSNLASRLSYKISNSMSNWVYGSFNSAETLKYLCRVQNAAGNSAALKRVLSLKESALSSATPDEERLARIKDVESLLKVKTVPAPEVFDFSCF